jgi:hypothetical protein
MAGGATDLFNGGDLHEAIGQGNTKPLRRGVVYQASAFPIALRVRPPVTRWEGVQFESGRFRFVQLQHLYTATGPLRGLGFITIEAAKGSTPSAARTIARLHATPHIKAGPITAAHVAGLAGKQFDAKIVGSDRPSPPGISLAPFTKNLHCGFCTKTMHGETLDVKFAGKDQLFRIIVIAVRSKTVVIYLESNFADQPKSPPSKTFPTFLPYAKHMLATLAFPG